MNGARMLMVIFYININELLHFLSIIVSDTEEKAAVFSELCQSQ